MENLMLIETYTNSTDYICGIYFLSFDIIDFGFIMIPNALLFQHFLLSVLTRTVIL